ncbi:hypothetical protein P152DRAFT_459514 [Eremomyces bilateralis CBS 781.70]|uniref:Uncharacterized protein n=1 Tax=Eremomyces bilateralis CBS 781.70 TaxID=1392243 RepID=A0A6G1G0W8_9PEZI|nr:uncharacterized protein P152DRAFT_459514 [Eremomyces bilateralis CBS 781.70]KAF1811570.1 hypothetical protein P152DRAFT_459514 [Eremomyces bilateralis CBS 781.70]
MSTTGRPKSKQYPQRLASDVAAECDETYLLPLPMPSGRASSPSSSRLRATQCLVRLSSESHGSDHGRPEYIDQDPVIRSKIIPLIRGGPWGPDEQSTTLLNGTPSDSRSDWSAAAQRVGPNIPGSENGKLPQFKQAVSPTRIRGLSSETNSPEFKVASGRRKMPKKLRIRSDGRVQRAKI